MSIKLMAFDLDGTLLNSHKEVTARTLSVVKAALDKGVYVTIATGRPIFSAKYFGEMICANVPLIACNGGVVQTPGEEPILAIYHADDTMHELLRFIYERGWFANWYIGEATYAFFYDERYFRTYRTTKGFEVQEVGDNFAPYTHHVPQCVMRNLDGKIPEMVAMIERKFAGLILPQQNTGYSVDITPIGVNKAVGVQALMKHLKLSLAEVMVCGDAANDLEMLGMGAFSVVPASGETAAKELASYVTEPNDEDGIAKAIEKFVL